MTVDYARTREAADPHCLGDGEAAAHLRGHPWRRFVVLGDSIAEGVSDPVEGYHTSPFADRVAAELAGVQPDLAYLNLGERNLRAGEVRAGQVRPALAFEPDLALVVCGANDALRPGYESRVDAVDTDIAAIVSAMQGSGALVVTVSVFVMGDYPRLPSWLGPAFSRRMTMLAARTRAIAAAHGTVHVHLADHPAADATLTCDDGLHGNGRGQAIAAAEMVRRLGAYLREPAAASLTTAPH